MYQVFVESFPGTRCHCNHCGDEVPVSVTNEAPSVLELTFSWEKTTHDIIHTHNDFKLWKALEERVLTLESDCGEGG